MDDVKVKKNKNSDHLGIMHPCSTTKERIRSPANIYKQTNTHTHTSCREFSQCHLKIFLFPL